MGNCISNETLCVVHIFCRSTSCVFPLQWTTHTKPGLGKASVGKAAATSPTSDSVLLDTVRGDCCSLQGPPGGPPEGQGGLPLAPRKTSEHDLGVVPSVPAALLVPCFYAASLTPFPLPSAPAASFIPSSLPSPFSSFHPLSSHRLLLLSFLHPPPAVTLLHRFPCAERAPSPPRWPPPPPL